MNKLLQYMSNPVLSTYVDTLEAIECKEHNKINILFKLNLRKIIKERDNKNKTPIYCVQGKMYYTK